MMKHNQSTKVKLTNTFLSKLKPSDRHRDISDDGSALTARILANGQIHFLWRGRIEGKQTKIIIGTFPEMSLNDARAECLQRTSQAKAVKLAPKVMAKSHFMTVEKAFEEYMQKKGDNLKSGPNVRSTIELRVMPKFGARDIKSLKRMEIANHFDDLIPLYNGAGVNRVLAHFKAFLTWCMNRGMIELNPCMQMPMPVDEKPRNRVLKGRELGYLQLALADMGAYHAPLMLLLNTCVRLASIYNLQWSEVTSESELDIGTTKNGAPHIIYLTPQMRKLIPVRPSDAKSTDFVFPEISRSRGSSILNKMRKRTNFYAARDNNEVPHFTNHDFRTACSTFLGDQMGRGKYSFSDRARNLLLSHVPKGVTMRHYNHAECLDEREQMLTLWSDHLDECLEIVKKDSANRQSNGVSHDLHQQLEYT